MASYEYRYIFVHIPRTGGSSVEEFLGQCESQSVDRFRQFLPGCARPFWEYYDEEMKEAVEQRYARDVEAFSYEFPG